MNTCQQCKFFVQLSGEINNKGYCHGLPPTVFSSGYSSRPEVKTTCRACSLFQERSANEPVPVKTKINPETPGAAAKASRRN